MRRKRLGVTRTRCAPGRGKAEALDGRRKPPVRPVATKASLRWGQRKAQNDKIETTAPCARGGRQSWWLSGAFSSGAVVVMLSIMRLQCSTIGLI